MTWLFQFVDVLSCACCLFRVIFSLFCFERLSVVGLVGWLIGWFGWLAGWLVGRSMVCLICRCRVCLVGRVHVCAGEDLNYLQTVAIFMCCSVHDFSF